MSVVTPVQGASSLLLQQAILVPAPSSSVATTTDVETADAVRAIEPISKHHPVTAKARSKVSEALFSAESQRLPAVKLRLIESVASALGINQENYSSDAAFRAAIRAAFDELAMNPDAREIIAGLPRDLGLDDLGASLKRAAEAARAATEARRTAEQAEEGKAEMNAAEAKAAAEPGPAAETARTPPAASLAEPPAGTKAEPQAAPPQPASAPRAESGSASAAAAPAAELAPASAASPAPAPTASSAPAAA
ncbi:hypothetical protein [Bosea thiooxidans]